jgi:hypothetical protein
MLRKTLVAMTAFAATLFFSLGCPQQDSNRETKLQPAPAVAAPEKANATRAPAAGAQPKPDAGLPTRTVAAVPKAPVDAPVAAPNPADAPSAPVAPSPGVLANDPPFKDWPKPKAVIFCSGMQMGYIEPCGCSGKENQRGGLSRRANLLKKLAADGWPIEAVDVGGQIERFGKQAELKFQSTADALKAMHYHAIGFSADDLKLPAESLALAVTDLNQPQSPFVSANAAILGFDQGLTPRFRIDTVGGIKIGITSILGDAEQKTINNPDVAFKPAAAALAEIMPELKKAKFDRLVLLAQASKDETLALVQKFPEFDFVVVSYGAPVPPPQPETAPGTKTPLIEVSQKAEYVNVIGLFDDPKQPVRFERVALDAHWGESPDMKRVMAEYQDQLKTLGFAGLGIKPTPHPSGNTFVGSKTCGECHTKAFAVWEKTPHAKALDTLVKLDPPRNFDPQCLSCHVTGWDPQRFHPFEGGYDSLQKTPQLADNGCENCHGPGSAHVAVESGNKQVTDKERDALRASMRVAFADAEKGCLHCHDGDNSINFKFDTYWPKVAHKGKD